MPQFSIYKSEHGVRNENEQLKRELMLLKRDNNRLRKMVGEQPIHAVEAQGLEVIHHEMEPQLRENLSGSGESFKTGNCTVTISRPEQGPQVAPVLNPMVARARAGTKKAATPAVIDIPAAQPLQQDPQQQQQLNGVDTDDAALRFSLIERS